MSLRGACILVVVLSGCAGGTRDALPTRVMSPATPTAPVPDVAQASDSEQGRRTSTGAAQAITPTGVPAPELPESCDGEGTKYCFPPLAFVEALCRDKYPGVAIVMFKKSQPWQHAFVKVRQVMAVNHYPGPRSHVPLAFSEEVLLLRHRPYVPRNGIDVRAPDNFDVLRLSGTCATLAEDELRTRWAGPSTYAPLLWSRLDASFRDALAQSAPVERARRVQSESCGGSGINGGAGCQRATDDLVRTIMLEVNAGLLLPRPEALPPWAPGHGSTSQ